MAKNFRADQIEVSQIILSGGIQTPAGIAPRLGAMIYSGTTPPVADREGGRIGGPLDNVGMDVMLFVSGNAGGKDYDHGSITLFGGDVVVSGTLYAERQVIEVDEEVTGSLWVSGSLAVSQSVDIHGWGGHIHDNGPFMSLHFTNGPAQQAIGWDGLDGHVDAAIFESGDNLHLSASKQVVILSSSYGTGGATSLDNRNFADTNFFVSGTIGSKGTLVRGTSVFGGDLVVSGNLTVEGAGSGGEWSRVAGGLYPNTPASTNVLVGETGVGTADTVLYSQGGAEFNKQRGSTTTVNDFLVYGVEASRAMLELDTITPSNDPMVLILSGGGSTGASPNPRNFLDTAFFLSGAVGSRNNTTGRGVATFGGDILASGSLTVQNVDRDGGTISGSIHHTEDGLSYLVAGTNVTITSGTNGQVTINSSGGGGGGGSEWTDSGGVLHPADSSGAQTVIVGDTTISDADIVLRLEGGADFNKQRGTGANNDFIIFGLGSQTMFEVDMINGDINHPQVLILSGGGSTSPNPRSMQGVTLFVSGGIGSRNDTVGMIGESVFGGDTLVSGSLTVENAGKSGGSISGSIHHTADGLSYLVGGSNVTIASGTNGQITISSTGGGGGGGMSSWTLTGDSGPGQNITNANTVVVEGGTGVVTEAKATDTVTVNLGYTGVSNYIDSTPADLEGTAIATGDTIAYHDADDNNVKKGFVSDLPFITNFTLAGDSGTQTIENGNTLDVAGGDGIITAAGATDTVTVNIEYTGVGNAILQASGPVTPVGADLIWFNDNDDGNIKKGAISQLPFTNNAGTVTSVGTGAGLTGGAITGTGTISVDYDGAGNFITAATDGTSGGTAANDDKLAIYDTSESDVRYINVSQLPGGGGGGSVGGTGANNQVAFWTGTNTIDGDSSLNFFPAGDGKLGLGVAVPSRQLHISTGSGAGYTTVRIGESGGTFTATSTPTTSNSSLSEIELWADALGGNVKGELLVHDAATAVNKRMQLGTISEHNVNLKSSNRVAMTISGSNRAVGIGTTEPSRQLHVYSGSGGHSRIRVGEHGDMTVGAIPETTNNTGARVEFWRALGGESKMATVGVDSMGLKLQTLSEDNISLKASNRSAIVISGSNRAVGIGTHEPAGQLHLYSGSGGEATMRIGEKGTYSSPTTSVHEYSRLEFSSNANSGNVFGMIEARDAVIWKNRGFRLGSKSDQTNVSLIASNYLAMTISGSNRHIGIGTTAPSQQLHIYSGSSAAIRIGEAGGNPDFTAAGNLTSTNSERAKIELGANKHGGNVMGLLVVGDNVSPSARKMSMGASSPHDLRLITNSQEHVVITAGATQGQVGIGTMSPSRQLHLLTGSGGHSVMRIGEGGTFGGSTTTSVTDFARIEMMADDSSNNVQAFIDARDDGSKAAGQLGTKSAHDLILYTADTERVTVQADGDFKTHAGRVISPTFPTISSPLVINNTAHYAFVGGTPAADGSSYARIPSAASAGAGKIITIKHCMAKRPIGGSMLTSEPLTVVVDGSSKADPLSSTDRMLAHGEGGSGLFWSLNLSRGGVLTLVSNGSNRWYVAEYDNPAYS